VYFRCTSDICEFEFASGYLHDGDASGALCLKCDTRYLLPSKKKLSPTDDELVELHMKIYEPVKHRGRKKHIPWTRQVIEPTGQFVIAQQIKAEPPSHRWLAYIGVDELECTACKAAGQIAIDLCVGDACPRCKTGQIKLEGGGVVYD
jgi:hypothetical protein